MTMYRNYFKRLFDFVIALAILIMLSPVLLILYISVLLLLGKPAIFKQNRPGYLGNIFTLYKFRTMKNSYDTSGNLLPDVDRLTAFGKFLRKTSLDELPEILNVLKGDMSLVGPRPLLVEYLPHYSPEQARRHHVRPGITGLAQVSGRNGLSWDEKFRLDILYVDHLSFRLDFKIILLTFLIVIRSQGVNAKNHATMPKFSDEK